MDNEKRKKRTVRKKTTKREIKLNRKVRKQLREV